MAEYTTPFRVQISTPDGSVLDEEFVQAKLPALDGYMGILAGRAPVTAVISTGVVTLTPATGKSREMFVSRGFLRAKNNLVRVLAEECKAVSELDAELAWDLLQRAYKMPIDTPEQRMLRDESVQAGRVRFALAQEARKGKGGASVEEMFSKGLMPENAEESGGDA